MLRVCHPDRPLVYACSGCTTAAQMTNYLALKLDRLGLAEMSCVVGVGAGISHLLQLARSGRPILVLDGCHLACARQCLTNQGIAPDRHLVMTRLGVGAQRYRDLDPTEAEAVAAQVVEAASELVSKTASLSA
ncbi:putative zinc-binding protein [Denitromonas iodatirespirans]|uniref:Zinc-binding protein n=1 Tax=Denitromonas iodatirespirans TaxID=2795389 RepID=A0A944D9F6_DENI1|nr:putative zinc-binding protein [Denitromonas iodatirespirans]MBT0962625.1 putative zinc-binding protein [Denitromonas iodatirespirans]